MNLFFSCDYKLSTLPHQQNEELFLHFLTLRIVGCILCRSQTFYLDFTEYIFHFYCTPLCGLFKLSRHYRGGIFFTCVFSCPKLVCNLGLSKTKFSILNYKN